MKYGLCLRGVGPKCLRDIELIGMGTVPIFTEGVSSEYFKEQAQTIPKVKKVKGRGLMLGLEFDFPVSELRKKLIHKHHIFTGSAKNPNLLRILPPLTIQTTHLQAFFEALQQEL